MLPLALLANPRNLLTAGLALGLAAASLFAYVQTVRLESANTRADALGQRLLNANAEVEQANQNIAEAAVINGRLNEAIARHREVGARLKAAQAQREALQRDRDSLAKRLSVETRTKDRARRERPDVPSNTEMTPIVADAMNGR